MYTYTVTIGRNVPSHNGEPMSALDWATFEDEVIEALTSAAWERQIAFVEVHRGMGGWDGVTEESVKIMMALKSALPELTEDCRDLLSLRNSLRDLVAFYGQDALALSIGECELILSQDR